MDSFIPVPILFGPTASGKTDVADRLFAADDGAVPDSTNFSPFRGQVEVISADSVQVYADLVIGAARPSRALMQRLPHHLVGVCDVQQEFSVADFVLRADLLCKDIYARGKLPVIVGGTAFYIKHFMYGLPVTPAADAKTRLLLQKKMQERGSAAMLAELRQFDPVSAEKIHVHDEYRILRAHEVYYASGKPLSSFSLAHEYRAGYRFCPILVNRPRAELYARIEQRALAMFKEGLAEEFRCLYEQGCRAYTPAMKAIGYREFFTVCPAHPIEAPVDEVLELIMRNTKRYAKRQQTFFQSLPCAYVFDADSALNDKDLVTLLVSFYECNRC
ncbi:MAG: tRNA (adenosine(37)-N6)-dimethylallyltransferase MiaA [Treponema sp.]